MQGIYNPPGEPCYRDLIGKVALVTGGGSGIGRGISLRLAAEGMHVFLCGRTRETLSATVDAIHARGQSATAIEADVSEEQAVQEVFARIRQESAGLDVLVHNAALVRGGSLERTDTAYWRRMLATNIDSAYYLARECAQVMVPRGSGSLVFISTIGAVRSHHAMLAYDTSKGAIDAFVRSVALELAPRGIRVNGIAPGATKRDEIPPGTSIEQIRQPYIPMQRYGTAAEIGAAVAFLASEQASYLTGQVICVDGGATAQLSPPGIFI